MAALTRIAHVTLQPYENDARVLRAIGALRDDGFECPVVAPGHGFGLPPFDAVAKARMALSYGAGGRLGARAARLAFFSFPHHRQASRALVALQPDAIHAHDWDGLIVAADAARRLGVPFAYDAHELASHMHAERRLWNLTVAPLIRALEPREAGRAEFVIGVSEGHAGELAKVLGLASDALAIRNISQSPAIDKIAPRDEQAPIRLHYHGAIARGRGIGAAISALAVLPERFRLRLTGPWMQPAFRQAMEARIKELDLAQRIEIVPPVPHDRLVDHASAADIGLCMLNTGSRHNAIALPNKVFDYLKAGLPVIASGTGELAFAESAGAAIVLNACAEHDLVAALETLDRPRIEEMRDNALRLAQQNDWSAEAGRLCARWRVAVASAPKLPGPQTGL